MASDLAGKVAVVTGGASGIGRGIVRHFASLGAKVVIADLNVKRASALEIELGGDQAVAVRTDVTDEASIAAAVELAATRFGRLDCMVNNAGATGVHGPIESLDAVQYRETMELLLFSVFMGMKHAVPHLRAAGGGSIVNISSIAGIRADGAALVYSAAKAAVIGATKAAALQLAPQDIRVNAIAPGGIVSSIFKAFVDGFDEDDPSSLEKIRGFLAGSQPIRRFGEPCDIAAGVAYLASDAARFVTGHTLVIDGGKSIGLGTGGKPDLEEVTEVLEQA